MMKKLTNNFMIRKTSALVDKIYVRLFPSEILPEQVENGPLVFHKNGNISLNYKDEQVRNNIRKHMKWLERITVEKN
ncbi:hypothetical protein [Avibacterium sp. 21-599]|uniref:hypothetical protein n=1 Tax=Avibacterium sp. 21-599 TaxID=2911528 RepID=UPI0022459A84|nr:hypothetical protein [Avibacterium sp. 21-599]MCW9717330.1 hypothetical protein [Avibacterium sp. 21-599]